MSENMKSRQNRVRRNVTALVSAVALACGTTAVVPFYADAFITDETLVTRHGDELGLKPEVSASVTLDKEQIQAGESFNASIRVNANAPLPESAPVELGQSNVTALIFELGVDPRISLTVPGEKDFKWHDGKGRQPFKIESDSENNTILFEFAGNDLGPNPSFTLDLVMTADEAIDSDDKLNVSVGAEADIRPKLDWTYGGWKMYFTDDPCIRRASGTLAFENEGKYGTWLGDLWLGSDVDHFRLEGDPTIKVLTSKGEDITKRVFPNDQYPESTLNPNAQPETFTGADGSDLSNYSWLRRYQWRLNERELAGDVWIPEGGTIQIAQNVSSTKCDFPDTAEFAAKVESKNAPLFSTAIDNASVTILGKQTVAAIGDRVWIDANGNGIQDDGETGVANVKVTATAVELPEGVSLTDAQRTGSAVTDADGAWQIDGLYPGATYKVEFDAPTLPEGFVPTRTGVGDLAKDSNGLSFNTDAIAEGTDGNNLTYDLGIFKPASVGDFVWDDGVEGQNDGIQGAGEAGVAGVTVTLTDKTGSPVTDVNGKQVEPRKTDADGKYLFENLFPGEYKVVFSDWPEGFKGETKSIGGREEEDSNGLETTVTLASGQSDLSVDLGLIKPKPVVPTPTATIGDRVWIDKNGNGIQDDGEPGVPNVKVSVREQGRGGGPAVETTTDGNGNWKVEGLTPGKQYNVRFELPNGYYETVSTAGEDLEKDSNGLTFSTKTLAEGSGGFNLSYDLGLVQPATIGDFVWDDGEYTVTGDGSKVGIKDTDYNGVQDSEEGIANVRVTLTDASGNSVKHINGKTVAPATTDADGKYLFENLRPGTYTVNFSYPQGYEETKPGRGDADKDSNGLTTEVTLESGQSDLTVDLGLVRRNATQTTTTITTPSNCTTCTPTTVTSNIPTTVKETETKVVVTTVEGEPTTLTRTTEVEVTKEVPTTVVRTTTNKVVVTDENTAIIGDKVFVDTNGDGKQDPNENEGVPGVSVIVTGKDGEEQRTVTDKDGNWHLVVQPGDFTVRYETDRIPSDPELIERTVTLKPGEENRDIDLGVLRPGSVGDRVWNDTNGDGKQDEGEEGIPNITVKISREGEPARFTVTDEKGFWLIDELSPNTDYTVEFLVPEGWTRTNEVPNTVKVKPGESIDTYDLGLRKVEPEVVEKPGSLNGVVRVKDKDGVERGFEGLVVTVTPPEGVDEETRRTVTDEGGAWSVTNLTPGVNYRVEYIVPEGYDVTNLPKGWTVEDGRIVVDQTIDADNPVVLELGFTLQPKVLAPTTVTETTTVTAPDGSSSDFLDRCWANATQSPLLYLVPVALLGAVAGEFAKPYMGVLNEQLAQINAELQAALNRNTPDFGDGGRGADRDDPFAELRAQINAANREVARIANDPDTQRLGAIALGVIGVIAAGGVIYDWCSSEPGEAVTASSIGKGKGATATPVTAPTTPTEPAAAQ